MPIDPINDAAIELRYSGSYSRRDRTLHVSHDAGFFSNCTVAVRNLHELQQKHGIVPSDIDFSGSFLGYRTGALLAQSDPYDRFFRRNRINAGALKIPYLRHHGIYSLLRHSQTRPLIDRFFVPSSEVFERKRQLIVEHQIDLAKTVAVVYRGTDKASEVVLAPPKKYIDRTSRILDELPDHRVWIQTDQRSVRDAFLDHFGDRCFFVGEMPVTDKDTAVHLNPEELTHDPADFGVLLLAVVLSVAGASYVVNHTGNMALWVCLYRGNSHRMDQFAADGSLVNWRNPRFLVGAARQLRTKLPGFSDDAQETK